MNRLTYDLPGLILTSIAMVTFEVYGISMPNSTPVPFCIASFIAIFYSRRATRIELMQLRKEYVIINDTCREMPTPALLFLFFWFPYSIIMNICVNFIKNDILMYIATFVVSFILLLITSTGTIHKMYKSIGCYYRKDYKYTEHFNE